MTPETTTLDQFFEQVGEGLLQMAKAVESIAVEIFEYVIIPICNAVQESYKEAGSPFGDTQEGLLLWMQVISAANRREQEAEHKRMHEELMLDARRLTE